MSPDDVRTFFLLRKRAHKTGRRLFLAKRAGQKAKGFAWLDDGPGSAEIVFFDSLEAVEDHIAALEQGEAA